MSKTVEAANGTEKVECISLRRAEGLLLVMDTPKGGVYVTSPTHCPVHWNETQPIVQLTNVNILQEGEFLQEEIFQAGPCLKFLPS